MKTVYFILGMHRSGTSALAGVLNIMGISAGDDLLPANDTNPKGYFENKSVYWHNEKILKQCNSSWSDHLFAIDEVDSEKKQQFIHEAAQIIAAQYQDYSKFIIKDPRICLLFPIWEAACQQLDINIQVIIPYRNPFEVAESLTGRNRFSKEKGLILWLRHFYLAEFYSKKYPRIFVSFNDLLDNTKQYIHKIADFTQLKVNKTAAGKIEQFLEKDFKHINIPLKQPNSNIASFLQKTITLLQSKNFSNEKTFNKIHQQFAALLQLFHYPEFQQANKQLLVEKNLNQSVQIKANEIATLNNQLVKDLHNQSLNFEHELLDKASQIIELQKNIAQQQFALNHIQKQYEKSEHNLSELQQQTQQQQENIQTALQTSQKQLLAAIHKTQSVWLNNVAKIKADKDLVIDNLQIFSCLFLKHVNNNLNRPNNPTFFAVINPLYYLKRRKNRKQQQNNLNIIKHKFSQIPTAVIEYFNAQEYLKQNIDVKQAIGNKHYDSALEHFILCGYEEIFSGARLLYVETLPFSHKGENKTACFHKYCIGNHQKFKQHLNKTPVIAVDFSTLESLCITS
ncbi:hypothetical protein MNBD_GAMMA01-1260 [hydrothermal vent metagenome]|uniref:Sulfotransferase domain-containing protein n=1 Tax=hydrothermal vent metagenome TaxID=652676 RepID=A0A3B0UWS0_9ZZZZ